MSSDTDEAVGCLGCLVFVILVLACLIAIKHLWIVLWC